MTRIEIGVERLPARAGLDPSFIEAVEPVTELNAIRSRKAQRGVVNLQVTRTRGE
jgi:hypothetical protein